MDLRDAQTQSALPASRCRAPHPFDPSVLFIVSLLERILFPFFSRCLPMAVKQLPENAEILAGGITIQSFIICLDHGCGYLRKLAGCSYRKVGDRRLCQALAQ